MNGFSAALAFYTRVPVRAHVSASDDLAVASPWFPVVGALVGVTVAGVYVVLSWLLPTALAATVAVAFGVLVTGAFHEDGLADVADAFAGGWTVERRLEILDDPRLGTFGVVAVVASFGARVTCIAALDTYAALALVPAAHALSRAPAVVLMHRQRVARADGLAASLARALKRRHERAAVGIALVVSALLIGFWAVPAAALATVVSTAFAALAQRKIGGTSGDVLGATQQLVELAVLVMGVAVVHNAWADLAWWGP